jgi:membrane protein DedA with SNARE-associated domain
MMAAVIETAERIIDAIGLIGVAVLIALESIFPPIPSEIVLLLAGFNVDTGRFPLGLAILAATIGSVVGAWALYGVGAWIRDDRMERFLARVGRWIGFTPEDVATGFRWFDRHGAKVVFFGRLIPVVRSVVSIPAGAERMPFWRFTLLTTAGSLLWNAVWIGLGNLLGDRWHQADEWHGVVNNVVMVAMVLGFVWLVFKARRRNRASRLALADDEA